MVFIILKSKLIDQNMFVPRAHNQKYDTSSVSEDRRHGIKYRGYRISRIKLLVDSKWRTPQQM